MAIAKVKYIDINGKFQTETIKGVGGQDDLPENNFNGESARNFTAASFFRDKMREEKKDWLGIDSIEFTEVPFYQVANKPKKRKLLGR